MEGFNLPRLFEEHFLKWDKALGPVSGQQITYPKGGGSEVS